MFLKGERIELRALLESDEEAEIWTRNVNAGLTTQFTMTGSVPMRPIDIKAVWKKEREAGSVEFGIWALMVDCGNLEYFFVGTCGLYAHRDIYRSWEFRILIFAKEYIGQGLGEEALRLVLGWGFDRLNAHRIWAGTHEENLGMRKVFEKCGFTEEGRLRDELFTGGKYAAAIRYGILEDEWRSSSRAKA